ncbi:hypothetical protein NEOLI_003857 [Neolecta irregularis DAH-3]|uniref:Uncharacterized protein n=1 Tax=Neolecta irregularis (strain DAH-3) TaxID=1198029 RepID=A0A1U7LRJ7_NEOID|nr:hypothetical protein NEOLI_003857 [Neolecta irregularis DAH-3]|eukprot:OLL25172.1 hypothetical protein NEOLI_003857 [Neolecta irregularis DAH-3]
MTRVLPYPRSPYPDRIYSDNDDDDESVSDISSIFSFTSPISSLCSSPPSKEYPANISSIPAVLDETLETDLREALGQIFKFTDLLELSELNQGKTIPEDFDLPDEMDPFVAKSSTPITAHNFALAISVLTKIPIELAICETITTCKVFESKEQVLRAAILLIARHVFCWVPINMVYLISSAVFIAFKCFSPSSDFEYLSIDWWAGKIGVSGGRVRRWESRFLKVICFDVNVQREEWIAWESWINGLVPTSCST